MKKLITFAIALFSITAFAQDSKMEKKATTQNVKYAHECYWMKDGTMIHCMGEKNEPMKANVTLKNGTVISTAGSIKTKDGNTTKIENGQCVTLMGSIGDCEKMHVKPDKATMPDQVK